MDEKNEIFLRVFALCEYVLVDQQNRYSLIGIYDKIFLVDTPAEFPIEMVLVISSDKKENDISVSIENPSGIIDEISKIKSQIYLFLLPTLYCMDLGEVSLLPGSR